jgi:hypothetical protein
MRNKIWLGVVLAGVLSVYSTRAEIVENETVFYGDIAIGDTVSAITNLTGGVIGSGGWRGQPRTFYYRVTGQNSLGRLEMSSVIGPFNIAGDRFSSGVRIQWSARPGVDRYLVQRSVNGSTWTNYISTSTDNFFMDIGPRAWRSGNIATALPVAAVPSTPWASGAQGVAGTNAQARVTIVETSKVAVVTYNVGMDSKLPKNNPSATNLNVNGTLNLGGTNILTIISTSGGGGTNSATAAQGIAGTNAQQRVSVVETSKVSAASCGDIITHNSSEYGTAAQGIAGTNAQERVSLVESDVSVVETGKVNAASCGDIITHNSSEYGTAAQGIAGTNAQERVGLVESDVSVVETGKLNVTDYTPGDPTVTNGVNARVDKLSLVSTLSYVGTNVTTSVTTRSRFRVTLTNDVVLANPTSAYDGQEIEWTLIQDGDGSRLLALDTKFNIPKSAAMDSLVLTTTNGMSDRLKVEYDANRDKFDIKAFTKAYAN